MIALHPIPTVVEEIEDPAEMSMHDPVYRAALIAAVKEGVASLEEGECITLEEMKKEFYSWFPSSHFSQSQA